MKLKIVAHDKDGYNGRDYPPSDSDIGLTVIPLKMEVIWFAEDGSDYDTISFPEALHESDRPLAIQRALDTDHHSVCWTCITSDGRTLELMDHEVSIVHGIGSHK